MRYVLLSNAELAKALDDVGNPTAELRHRTGLLWQKCTELNAFNASAKTTQFSKTLDATYLLEQT